MDFRDRREAKRKVGVEPGARPNRGGGVGCACALAVYKPPPPKKHPKKVRRKLTTNAFEGTVSLLLRRDPESFSVAGRMLLDSRFWTNH
jgi:hypothetical protein